VGGGRNGTINDARRMSSSVAAAHDSTLMRQHEQCLSTNQSTDTTIPSMVEAFLDAHLSQPEVMFENEPNREENDEIDLLSNLNLAVVHNINEALHAFLLQYTPHEKTTSYSTAITIRGDGEEEHDWILDGHPKWERQ
jgi:hypothetical protein